MKSLAILAMSTLLFALIFQCCPSAPSEAPPVEVPTEQPPLAPSEPPSEEPTPSPPSEPTPQEPTPSPPPAEPTPTSLPPSPTPAPQPLMLQFSGHGNEAMQSFFADGGLIRCAYTHDGERNFIAHILDRQRGNAVVYLANEIGPCEGSTADRIPTAGEYLLSVMADGNWTFSCEATGPVDQPPATAAFNVHEFSGQGNTASQQFPLVEGLLRCNYSHDGQRNFIVHVLDDQGETAAYLANEIGPCEGSSANEVRITGEFLLDVMADGNWTITLSQ